MPNLFVCSNILLFIPNLSSGDGLAGLLATLPRVQAALDGLGTLLDDLSTLGEDELDVGGVGHVRVDLDLSETGSSVALCVHTRPWAR
jgi:hypothetical protein